MSCEIDKVILRARRIFERSGLSLEEIGLRMGYSGKGARKSAWQFLNKISDPRLSTVRRFAEAMNISLVDLLR